MATEQVRSKTRRTGPAAKAPKTPTGTEVFTPPAPAPKPAPTPKFSYEEHIAERRALRSAQGFSGTGSVIDQMFEKMRTLPTRLPWTRPTSGFGSAPPAATPTAPETPPTTGGQPKTTPPTPPAPTTNIPGVTGPVSVSIGSPTRAGDLIPSPSASYSDAVRLGVETGLPHPPGTYVKRRADKLGGPSGPPAKI